MFHLAKLEQNFNDEEADTILRVEMGETYLPVDVVTKSLYNFSLDTPEGLERLVELLPILSKTILTSVYKELFLGYPAEKVSSRQMAIELKGFLLDVLSETEAVDEE